MRRYKSTRNLLSLIMAIALFSTGVAQAALGDHIEEKTTKLKSFESVSLPMYLTAESGKGKFIGTVNFKDTEYGMLITPHLKNLSPGIHGFHIHQNPDCSKHGLAAGGHYDPGHTGKHLGPYRRGHLGDLPALYVDKEGRARLPILAPRLKVSDTYGHSLMIHVGGDNYSDYPRKLGGGGARLACGVINKP